jgi:hypothetical protein
MPKSSGHRIRGIVVLCAILVLASCVSTHVRTATDATGGALHLHGSVALIDPDIELSEVTTGGMQEPRRDWTEAARRLYPDAVRELLAARGTRMLADYHPPVAMPSSDRIRQLLLLHQAVATSILVHGQPGNELANKQDRFDWTLGPGAQLLQQATGADYGLFTYIRDSYTSSGRTAMRVVGALLLAGDIGGGEQVGLATLVDLRTGRVVWFNLLQADAGDLRDAAGARDTVARLLKDIPL